MHWHLFDCTYIHTKLLTFICTSPFCTCLRPLNHEVMKSFSSTTLLTILWLVLLDAMRANTIDNVRIVEGVPTGQVIYDFNECSQHSHTSTYLVRTATVENRYMSVFNQFFTHTNAIITAKIDVDRDAIAAELLQTHLPVSFEVRCLVIMVADGTVVVSRTINLEILDRNDNSPRFRTTGVEHISIRETMGNIHLLELAIDPDQGVNSTQTYFLEPPQSESSPFSLDVRRNEHNLVSNLRLVIGMLDREVQSNYVLHLIARENATVDANPPVNHTINITVLDICDESPMFPMSRFQASILENSPLNSIVLTNVTATDSDELDQGMITYTIREVCSIMHEGDNCRSIESPVSPFILDYERGDLTLLLNAPIDREEYVAYEINIIAEDTCGRQTTATVEVTVGDVNDNAPTVQVSYLGSTPETQSVNTTILLLTIEDLDHGNNQGAQPSFNITMQDNTTGVLMDTQTFYIDLESNTWHVKLGRPLDREVRSYYSLVINTTDREPPHMFTITSITIIVADVNDNVPIFDPIPPSYNINEEHPVDVYRVATVTARDADSKESGNGNVGYSLPPTNSSYPFQDYLRVEEDGDLIIARRLDREQLSDFFVLVQAQDNPMTGTPHSVYVVINITLLDINDVTPSIISPPNIVTVLETEQTGSVVFTVQAEDNDTAPFSNLTYSMMPSENTPFTIHPRTGQVYLVASLDYELTTEYTLMVYATDQVNTANKSVSVEVQNVNDERCVFDDNVIYSTSINESEAAMYRVFTVHATDRDTPSDQLRFSIVSGSKNNFTIDPSTGEIYTTQSLDNEVTSNYTLIIQCSDGSGFPTVVSLAIQVLDINDNPPRFSQSDYSFNISENLPEDTRVGYIFAEDSDSGSNGFVQYTVHSTRPAAAFQWFRIELSNGRGKIVTTQGLDREDSILEGRNGVVMLSVVAADMPAGSAVPLHNNARVFITITDRNDNKPVFRPNSINVTLREDEVLGTNLPIHVMAVDIDSAPFNTIEYSISEHYPEAIATFNLHMSTGIISLRRTLDYEEQQSYMFEVQAIDTHNRAMRDYLVVSITVRDVVVPGIRFIGFDTIVQVQENVPVNHSVTDFRVTDKMGDPILRNGDVSYSILDQSTNMNSQDFGLESDISDSSLIVKVLRNIDREMLSADIAGMVKKMLNITASSETRGSVSAIMTITISDDNDNRPRFAEESYTFEVEENNDIAVSIGTISATDIDFGTNGSLGITYQVTGNVPFTVAGDGELRSSESLDFEMEQSYSFRVTAYDGGTPPKTSDVMVRVNVCDLNDNAPQFSGINNRTFPIREDKPVSSTVVQLVVSDQDSGRFGDFNLTMGSVPSQHFEITPNGSIKLIRPLDRETATSHFFTVVAVDGGGLRTTADIAVRVEDFNDNKPVFDPIPTVIINETQPEQEPFIRIRATDKDIGPNSIVRYAIGDPSLHGTFCINTENGDLSLCAQHASCEQEIPNYENRMRYTLNVVAYDLGTPRNIVSQNVTIIIEPINEHAPEFDKSMIDVYANETRDSNAEIVRIQATDHDSPEQLSYEVLGMDRGFFHYDLRRGALISNVNLNYNERTTYDIDLQATDSGGKTGSVNIFIVVVNINDNPPVFDINTLPNANQPLVIRESIPVSTVIWRVQATDEDDSNFNAVQYSIQINNDDGKFVIDHLTGEVIVNASLDYEEMHNYNIEIVASDTGTPPLSSPPVRLWVSVQDENDELPQFNASSYSFSVAENTPVGTNVGALHATDRDAVTISYSIADGVNNLFDVDVRSGYIFTLREIDWETEASKVITFTVEAIDGAPGSVFHTDTAEVSITITDVNDNAPILASSQYLESISPSQQVNISISTSISSSDEDSSDFSQFHYELEGPASNLRLQVLPSGWLVLLQPVPLNHLPAYTYTLKAVDNNNPSLSSTARLDVLVETTDSHHPRFSPVENDVRVTESTPRGSSIFTVSSIVTDADNDQVMYAFEQPYMYPEFGIDGNNGSITLNEMLDYETIRQYNLTILATDATQRTSVGIIRVVVLPENEFSPHFDSIPSHYNFSYLDDIDIELFTVRATDQDEGEDGRIEYSLPTSNLHLDINRQTGVVRNRGMLDRSMDFTVTIQACDCGNIARTATAVVRISTHDPGASKPTIAGKYPRTIMRAEVTPVNSLLTVALISNRLLTSYHLVKQTVSGSMDPIKTFSVTEAQGRLRLEQELDYETENRYTVVVEARVTVTNSTSEIRASDFLQITVEVTNVNDNNPVFMPIGMQRIMEDQPVDGSTLFQVMASDRDLGEEGVLSYDFCQGNTGGTFSINMTSGAVKLQRALDREAVSSYSLCIQATDRSISPHSAQVQVHIEVLDVNDYVTTFGDRNYSLSVYEYPATTIGTRVMKLSATDLDKGPPLTYSMVLVGASLSSNSLNIDNFRGDFVINRSSGTINVASISLDRETVDNYLYYVTATDRQNTAETYLSIHILDVDDHAPELIVQDIRMTEGAPVGTVVTDQIVVMDPDSGTNKWVEYSLGAGWPGDYFKINPLTGVIRVNRRVVSLENSSFEGEVIAIGQGGNKRRAIERIDTYIQDVNDHAPMFTSSSITFMHQVDSVSSSQVWSPLHRFNTTDEDYGLNALPVQFNIPGYYMQARDNFMIESDGLSGEGELQIRQPQTEVKTYHFRIDVSNSAFNPMCARFMQASSINVTVHITPVNLGGPEFAIVQYSTQVVEESRDYSQPIARVQATDVDGDSIVFFFASQVAPFRIDSDGNVYADGPLDREEQSEYTLVVRANDTGFPSKSNYTNITVTVTDINDNAPVFTANTYYKVLMENSPVNTPVLTVSADDVDLGENRDVSFQIMTDDVPFSIDPASGSVVVSGTLDYESSSAYLFEVVARDGGNPPQTSTALLNISLADDNEHPPMFAPPPQQPIRVGTDKRVGDVVYITRAVDQDPSGQLQYSFVNSEPKCYFDINSRTGEITLKVNPNNDQPCEAEGGSVINSSMQSDPSYFIVAAVVRVSDGIYTADTTIDFSLHNSFGAPVPVMPSSSLPIEIIGASILGVVIVVFIFVVIVIVACCCRCHRTKKYVVGVDSNPTSMEMTGKKFGSTRSQSSITKTTTSLGNSHPDHTTVAISGGSGTSSARHSYVGNGEVESGGGSNRLGYNSPANSTGKMKYRSTSDLGSSTMNTDMLSGNSQETAPYDNYAQIKRIYAKNADLLDDQSGSNESIHMFGSEGGGESDGGDDLYGKFNEYDDDDDSTTMQDDDEEEETEDTNFRRDSRENVNLTIDPMEIQYGYGRDNHHDEWGPRVTNMAETIDQIAYETGQQMRHGHYGTEGFSKSQEGMYGGGTQDSSQPLLRHGRHPLHHQQHTMAPPPQQTDFYYDDRSQDMRFNDHHHMMREPPSNYTGPPAGMPSYSSNIQHHVPIGRHPGGPSIRGGASQEVPPMYDYHHDSYHIHHPLHDLGTGMGHSPSSTPTEEALNTRNEYESDLIYSSDTSLNTNTESEQFRQLRGPTKAFSQSSASQRHPYH